MKVKNKRSRKQLILRRGIRAFFIGWSIALIVIWIKLIPGVNLFKQSVEIPSIEALQQPSIEEQTIANNIDTLVLLQEDTWITLPTDEKLRVLQTAANIERRYLGLPNELIVSAEDLNDESDGYYSDSKHQIVISMDSLCFDSSREVLNTITHEAYHSLQHRMVDAYDEASEDLRSLIFFHEASKYKEEFENYIHSSEDFSGYYSQKCEEDARRYAEQATNDYFEKIAAYLNSD